MVFGVPTMYGRIARDAAEDGDLAEAFGGARVLISGSAALPTSVHERIKELTGQDVLERYGLTETLMNAGARLGDEVVAGRVGPPLPGVEVQLIDEDGDAGRRHRRRDDRRGRGPRPERVQGLPEPAGRHRGGDARRLVHDRRHGHPQLGRLAALVGRKSTDLIKSGGYRIGAGEIEGALLEHPAVADVAVTAKPDDDLGERIVAWVVLESGGDATADELSEHVASLLTKHKRPREVNFIDELPRNAMGKVMSASSGTTRDPPSRQGAVGEYYRGGAFRNP